MNDDAGTLSLEDRCKGVRLVEEHTAGGGAHEDLNGRHQVCRSGEEFGEIIGSGAHHEGIVGCRGVLGARHFVLPGSDGGGLRDGVGHVDEGGDATGYGGAALRGDSRFGFESGLAEVDVAVDSAGHQQATAGIDHLGAGRNVATEVALAH